MKSKYFLVILFLTLAIFLSSCGGLVTPVTDEAKVRSVVNEYFLAINDQNWSKAKNCCVYESQRYYATCAMEDLINNMYQLYSVITITCYANIYNVTITGNYAEVYIDLTFLLTYDYNVEDGSVATYYYLQKIGNNWKIYGP